MVFEYFFSFLSFRVDRWGSWFLGLILFLLISFFFFSFFISI